MIKKTILVGLGAVLVLGLLFGGAAVSYVRTSAGYVRQAVHDSVPIEFQIQRARGMIADLIPEIRKNMHVIAKEEVEIARLEEQIAQARTRLGKEKEELLRLHADLSDGRSVYRYAGRSYTADEVKEDLARRFERYKTGEATLGSLEQIHSARVRSLDAARRKLEGMMAARRQLQVEVENLQARVQMLAAARATSDFQFDESKLGQVKELIADLQTRLDVAERLLSAETDLHDEIPLDESTPENIVDEVTEYFNRQPSGQTAELTEHTAG